MKVELRAITNSHLIRDSPVVMSSTMPSAKYSCSGSPLMFWNGSTAIDGLSGSASDGACAGRSAGRSTTVTSAGVALGAGRARQARIGSVMFFSDWWPMSS